MPLDQQLPSPSPSPAPFLSSSSSPPTNPPTPTQTFTLTSLPTELHLSISTYLSYPDALALKHTNRHFYGLVYTGVHLKVDWLVDRFEQKLDCPLEKCSFRTDEAFCNARISRIILRRRRHLECKRSIGGCRVVRGRTCRHTKFGFGFGFGKGFGKGVMGVRWIGGEVLTMGFIFLCVYILWTLAARYMYSLFHRSRVQVYYPVAD